jgi:hypothetical protein
MNSKFELHENAKKYLHEKFNVLLELDCRTFDTNVQMLLDALASVKVDVFMPNDKIVISHMDTDYYDPLLPCGLAILNIVRCMKMVDVPFANLIFVTNHFGIKKEFDLLLADNHVSDRPTVVETLLSPVLLGTNYLHTTLIESEQIEKQSLCLLGQQRSHRVALYNFLKNNNLLDKVALTTNFLPLL